MSYESDHFNPAMDEDGFLSSYREEEYEAWDAFSEEDDFYSEEPDHSQRIDPETGEIIGAGLFTVEEPEEELTEELEEETGELRGGIGSSVSCREESASERTHFRQGDNPESDTESLQEESEEPIYSRPEPVPTRRSTAFPKERERSVLEAEALYPEPEADPFSPAINRVHRKWSKEASSYFGDGFCSSERSSQRERPDYAPQQESRTYTKDPVPKSYGSNMGKNWRKESRESSKANIKDFSEIPSYELYSNDGKLEYETGFHKDEGRSEWEDYSTDGVEQSEEELEPSFSDRVLDFLTGKGDEEEAGIKRQSILIGVLLFLVLTLASQVFAQLRNGDLLNMSFTFNIPWILWNDGPVIVLVILLGSVLGGVWRYVEWRAEKARETGEPFTLSGKGTYGTARFATRNDLKGDVRFGVRNRPVGIPLCIDPETGDSVSLTYESGKAKHVCVTGLSGSGKGTLIKAQVMSMIDHGWSYVIADPSGDIYKSTATLAEKAKAGYDVYVFNLNDLSVSDGWNPLSIIQKSSQPDVMTTSMANSIILNSKQPGEKSDSFYDANEQNLLAALMLYTSVSPMFKGQSYERNLGTVYDMLSRLAETGDLQELDNLPSIDPAKAPWNFFKNPKAEKLQPNFVTGLNAKIQTLGLDPVREVLSHDEIDLKRIGQKPTAVYVLTSVVDTKFRFLLSLFFTSAFQQLIEYGDSKDSPEMDNPVYFIMDEFASIGVIPNFMQILANVRKYDIGIEILFQDINQIRQVYGRDDSGSIISNCGKRIVYEVNDAETAKEVSGRTGEATIKNTSISESVNPHSAFRVPSYDQKQSTSDGKRNLLTPDEIMTYTKKSKENMLLISEGKPVFKGKKYRYWYHWLAEFVSDPQNIKPSGDNVPDWSLNQKTTELPRTWGGSEVSEDILKLYRKPSSLEEAEERQKLIEEQKKKQAEEDRIREAERRAEEEEQRRAREESERREAEEFERHKQKSASPKKKSTAKPKTREKDSFDLTGLGK